MHSTEHVPKTAWDEPCLMKNMVISQKAPFMKTLRYIFLTEWQLCAKRVDPGVPHSAQGTIKPTAYSTHGPPCPKDRAEVVGTGRSFGSLIALEQRGLSLFMTGARLQGFILDQPMHLWVMVQHWQIHLSFSNQGFLETRLSVKNNPVDRERQGFCWQRFRPVQVMCELVTRSKDGSGSDKWSSK